MEKKKTVLFVETGNHGGGSFESLYQNVAHMDHKRFKPIVVYLNRTHQLGRMKNLGVDVYLIKDLLYNKYMPEWIKKVLVGFNWMLGRMLPKLTPIYEFYIHLWPIIFMKYIIKKYQVDIIQLNNNMLRNFFCIVGLKNMHIPIICYLRSFIIKGVTPYMASYSNKHVSRYVAYSEGVKDYWSAVGVDAQNTEVIHNGIEINDIEPVDVWERIGIKPKNGPLVGCVGAVKVNRTYDFMIRSMVHILEEEPQAHLVIIGTWMDVGLAEKLQDLIDHLGIGQSVTLHGHDPLAKWMIAGFDMLTIPYRVEPFGRILLEAWLAGTPVIATHVGHIDKIITHGKDGLLVNHGDERAMCSAALRLWQDKDFRDRIIKDGRETVESRFSIEKCTEKLESLYNTISKEKNINFNKSR